jgi:hypothetical protein
MSSLYCLVLNNIVDTSRYIHTQILIHTGEIYKNENNPTRAEREREYMSINGKRHTVERPPPCVQLRRRSADAAAATAAAAAAVSPPRGRGTN